MLLALAALLVGSSAISSPASTSAVNNRLLEATPGQTLRYSIGEEVQVADVSRDGFFSADVNLRKLPGRLNGSVGREPVTMRLEPNRLDGHIGDNPIGLDVIRAGDGLRIMGQFGVRAVALEVRSSSIDGQVGPCFFRLAPEQGIYFGQVSCGGPPRQVRLTLPVSLVARPDAELAAMLVAILAR
jgi:hypothetical protein